MAYRPGDGTAPKRAIHDEELSTPMSTEIPIQAQVRARYAEAAIAAAGGTTRSDAQESCCDPFGAAVFGRSLYAGTDLAALPEAAALASLGCGNPTAVAELRPGETVLDLGSGGGIDVLLSAQRVGPTGRAIGVDMTDEMLDLARRNAAEAGATNVEFRRGTIEDLPVDADSIDVVISNCVVNLSGDKAAVIAEIARVLRPGGRVGISDVVADDTLSSAERAERGSFVGCIAGALSFSEYRAGLEAAGLTGVSIEVTHEVADGMHGAMVRAVKPARWSGSDHAELSALLSRPIAAFASATPGARACGCGAEGCC